MRDDTAQYEVPTRRADPTYRDVVVGGGSPGCHVDAFTARYDFGAERRPTETGS
jgi:hypothetical protein